MRLVVLSLVFALLHPITADAQPYPVSLRGVDVKGVITDFGRINNYTQQLGAEVNFLLPVTLQDDPEVELNLQISGQLRVNVSRSTKLEIRDSKSVIGAPLVGVLLVDIGLLDRRSRARGQIVLDKAGTDVLFGWREGQRSGTLSGVEVTIPGTKEKVPFQYGSTTGDGPSGFSFVVEVPTFDGGIENYMITGIAQGGGDGGI